MALLSLVFTALARKMGDILQALFGWSVAALFGRLNSKTQTYVTIALVLSLAWPVFVVGVFSPAAASFVLAFVPIQHPVLSSVLRVLWIVLAIAAPLIVGVLVRQAVPLQSRKSLFVSMINGYPLAFGMALSFLITVVTVPAVKIVTIVKGWKEEHVFVQPKERRYDDVLRHLVDACEAAGLLPMVEKVPVRLALSTRVARFFSRGAIDSFIAPNPRRVVCTDLELWLYPSDLLIRGKADRLAAVRSRMAATMLERDAWLVQEKKAQDLQEELGRLWDVLQDHALPEEARPGLVSRLKSIVRESFDAHSVTFDDWMTIDRMSRRLEGRLAGMTSIVDQLAGEPMFDERKKAARSSRQQSLPERANVPQLVEALARESKELAMLEAEMARNEASDEINAAKRSGIAMAASLAVLGAVLSLVGVAIVLFLGGTAIMALGIAGGLLGIAVIVALIAYAGVPKDPMARTRKRLSTELKMLQERAS